MASAVWQNTRSKMAPNPQSKLFESCAKNRSRLCVVRTLRGEAFLAMALGTVRLGVFQRMEEW